MKPELATDKIAKTPIAPKQSKSNGLISEFVKSAEYTAIQEPVSSLAQITDALHNSFSKDKWHKDLKFMDAPKPAKFGSLDWAAQNVGSAVGIIAPFMLAQGGVSMSLDRLGVSEASQSLLTKSALSLDIRNSALAGATYGALFTPVDLKQHDFLTGKIENSLSNALTFGTLTAGSIGVASLGESGLVDKLGAKSLLTNKIFTGATAGLPAGFVAAEFNSLVNNGKLASKQEIEQSLAGMALIGGVFGAKSQLTDNIQSIHIINPKLANISETKIEAIRPDPSQPSPEANNRVGVDFKPADNLAESKIAADLGGLPNDGTAIRIDLDPSNYEAFKTGITKLGKAVQSLQSPDLNERLQARNDFINFALSPEGQSVKLNLIPVAKNLGSYATNLVLDGYSDKPSQIKIQLPLPELKAGNAIAFAQESTKLTNSFNDFQSIADRLTLASSNERPDILNELKQFLDQNPNLHDTVKSFASQKRSSTLAFSVDDYFKDNQDHVSLANDYHSTLKPSSPVFEKIKAALAGQSILIAGNIKADQAISGSSHVLDLSQLHSHELDQVKSEIAKRSSDLTSSDKATQIKSARFLTQFIGGMDVNQFKDWYNATTKNLLQMNLPMGSVLVRPEINEAINNQDPGKTIDPSLIQAYLSGHKIINTKIKSPEITEYFDNSKQDSNLPNWFRQIMENNDTKTNSESNNISAILPDKLAKLANILDSFKGNNQTINSILSLDNIDGKAVDEMFFKLGNPKTGQNYFDLIKSITEQPIDPQSFRLFTKALSDYNPNERNNVNYKSHNEHIATIVFHKLASDTNMSESQIADGELAIHNIISPPPRFFKPNSNYAKPPRIDSRYGAGKNNAAAKGVDNDTENSSIPESADSKTKKDNQTVVSKDGNTLPKTKLPSNQSGKALTSDTKISPIDKIKATTGQTTTITPDQFDRDFSGKEDRSSKRMAGREKDRQREKNRDRRFED